MLCVAPAIILGAFLTLQPNEHHTTNMDGAYLEVQSCVQGLGVYASAATSELYTGGIQYGFVWQATERLAVIVQPHVGASYPSRWVPELPNQVQFDTGIRLLARYDQFLLQVAWGHQSHAGLGRDVIRDGRRYGNTGLDEIKLGVGYRFWGWP